MKCETIILSDYYKGIPKNSDGFKATLTTYVLDWSPEFRNIQNRPSVVICPGGGYGMTSSREAEPIALEFTSKGYNAFVLRYSVAPAKYPQALLEVSAALDFIRKNAEAYRVDKELIAVCGFSAGGHLAASHSVFWNEAFLADTLETTNELVRPNATILCYPVISSGEFAHRGSFDNLLGEKNLDSELLYKLSLENSVNDNVPPTFIWHTFNDGAVPVENSLLYATALRKNGIPFDLHIFRDGNHGLSTCNRLTNAQNDSARQWIDLCLTWLSGVLPYPYV